MQGQKPPGEKKNSNKTILIIAIAVAVAVCVVFFLYRQGVFQNLGNRSDNTIGSGSERVVVDDDEGDQEKEIDHSEAYDAYLDVLLEEKNNIDMYGFRHGFDWGVSFLEVEEMSHPLMVIEALVDGEYEPTYDNYYFSKYLRVYSYIDGLYMEVDNYVRVSEWGNEYCSAFTTTDGYLYFVRWEGDEGGCHLIIKQYIIESDGLFEKDNWTIDFDMLPYYETGYPNDVDVVDTEYWRNASYGDPDLLPPLYHRNGESVPQGEFFDDIDKILGKIDTMAINDVPEIIIRAVDGDLEKTFSLKSYRSNAKTYDNAIEYLGGVVPAPASPASTTSDPVFPYISASSTRAAMGSNSYGPEKAYDNDWSTAWCEGQSGNGVGAWIELSSDNKQTVTGIQILNGYCKSEKTYYDNNTISEVRIVTDEGDYSWLLMDLANTYQEYYFNAPIETKSIRIYLERVNEKGDGLDTLISELSAF